MAANIPANFAAPHSYNTTFTISGSQTIAAGASGYFIIVVNTDAAATTGNTVKVNGAANPVTFGYATSPTIVNNQTDIAGTQTILAAGVTLTTSAIAAANIAQGTINNVVYAVKMDVTSLPVTVTSIQFTLTGTHDNNDLTVFHVYFNPTAPTVAGAAFMAANIPANFAAPHSYNTTFTISGSQTIAAGASGYFIIVVNTDAAATTGNTVKVNGAANPVTFGYVTVPPVINNQTDAAGAQTITGILPLTLLSFAGNITNAQVQLQWKTAQEQNTKDFEVEWSTDGIWYNKIATLNAAGNSTNNRQYSYLHKQPADGNNYYRLKMLDINGQFTYSGIIKIETKITVAAIAVAPNPVGNVLHLNIQATRSENVLFRLNSADGKIIDSKYFTIVKGSNLLNWNVRSIPAGNYFITAANDQFKTLPVIKK
jgi:hypothetical protein